MPQYVIGVDLGTHSVKAVVAERGFRGVEIESFHEIPVEGADRYPLAELIERVRKPGATWGFRLAGDRVALRVLNLPFVDSKSIEQVIPGEVEAVLPFELDNIVYDTHVGARRDEGSRVVVAAARQSDIASFLQPLTEAHVDPRVLDAEPLGLAALAVIEPSLREGNVLIVDAGQRKTGVVALENGSATFGRTLAMGAGSIRRAVAEEGSFADQSDHLGIGTNEALDRAARALAQEISRTVSALERTGAPRPDRLLLVGGLSLMPGFPQLVEQVTRIPVHLMDLDTAELGADKLSREELPRAAAAIALAVRAGGENKPVDINLRKNAFAYHRDTRVVSRLIVRGGLMVGILLLLAGVDFGVKSQMLRSERRAVRAQISAKVAPVVPEADPKRLADDSDYAVSVLSNEVKKLTDQVSTLTGSSVSSLDALKEVSSRVPKDISIDITKFDFSNGQLRLDGTTDSFGSVDKILEALKAEPAFFYEAEVVNRGSSDDKKTFKILAKTTRSAE